MAKAVIFFADGLEEIEGLTVVDMFRRVGIEIDIVSVTGSLNIEGSHKIRIQADKLFEDVDYSDVDMLILPGGMPGTLNLQNHKALGELLVSTAKEGKQYIAAICAAPTVLGALGILEGYRATCYPRHETKLLGAKIEMSKVVVDRNIITSRGMGTAIEFAAQLVAILKDAHEARELLGSIVYSQN